jgi:triacylglycerol lipase
LLIPPGFDKSIALEAAALVNLAYEQYTQRNASPPWSLQGNYDILSLLSAQSPSLVHGIFEHKEVFGFVARNRATGTVFVIFRGTESPGDWLSNISFPQVPFRDQWGNVERGFAEIYIQMSQSVIGPVHQSGAANVIVTGHSLGGALSTLATADLAPNGMIASLYNFASPRTGNPEFTRKLNATVPVVWRVVNTEDIVTTVPLATAKVDTKPHSLGAFDLVVLALNKLDYMHVGSAVTFTAHEGSIIDNHKMATYIAGLNS